LAQVFASVAWRRLWPPCEMPAQVAPSSRNGAQPAPLPAGIIGVEEHKLCSPHELQCIQAAFWRLRSTLLACLRDEADLALSVSRVSHYAWKCAATLCCLRPGLRVDHKVTSVVSKLQCNRTERQDQLNVISAAAGPSPGDRSASFVFTSVFGMDDAWLCPDVKLRGDCQRDAASCNFKHVPPMRMEVLVCIGDEEPTRPAEQLSPDRLAGRNSQAPEESQADVLRHQRIAHWLQASAHEEIASPVPEDGQGRGVSARAAVKTRQKGLQPRGEAAGVGRRGGYAGAPAKAVPMRFRPVEAAVGDVAPTGLMPGRGSWGRAFVACQGTPHQAAFDLLCKSGIVTRFELSGDSEVPQDHIEECVHIAEGMLEQKPLSRWLADGASAAKECFQQALAVLYDAKMNLRSP